MDRVKKTALILALVAAVMAVDKLWIHLIRWERIGVWIEALAKLFKG